MKNKSIKAACGLFYLIAAFNDDVAPCLEIYDLEMQDRVDIWVEQETHN
ncbi:hypothetical protein [Nostoc sp.]